MDKVFQEEQNKLTEIEKKIDVIASRYESRFHEMQREISDYFCVDNEDRMRKREMVQESSSLRELAAQYRTYQYSPYFGRLDLDAEGSDESEIHYIGKEGISYGSDIIVVDWRTPLGSCYYASNQREFNVNGTTYSLALRRAIEVQNGKLINYRTEYDGETVSLEGDVIDPFLLTVLKDKRRHNRLTDIIRTIQGNQNDIIRRPISESFVVQGCAGSGKTMILLHRLSFLKFNNRNMSLDGVRIITPNRFFDAHINDLSSELGLNAIKRFSVEEYYVSLLKGYSSRIIADSDVQSEKILSADLLRDIYSIQYLHETISRYHEYWAQMLSSIDETNGRRIFDRLHLQYPNMNIHTIATVSALEQSLRRLSASISENKKSKVAISDRLITAERRISELELEYSRVSKNLTEARNQGVDTVNHEIEAVESDLQVDKQEVVSLRQQIAESRERIQIIQEKTESNAKLLRMLSQNSNLYSNFENFRQQNDNVATLIRANCADIIRNILDLGMAYEKIPVYNFGKRNSLRKDIAENKSKFEQSVRQIILQQTQSVQEEQEALRLEKTALNAKISELEKLLRTSERTSQENEARLSVLRDCLPLFEQVDASRISEFLSATVYRGYNGILAKYKDSLDKYDRISQQLQAIRNNKKTMIAEIEELERSAFSEEDLACVETYKELLRKLQLSDISRHVMFRDLFAKYRQYNQKYIKANFRHKLYLKLLICCVYYARPANSNNYLHIDEAQDLSVAEYHLLRMAHSEKCIFNLYGDINQSVYSYKGIADWDEIADITGGHVYVLNENYRNSLQITNFCNQEFGAEVYPIGVSGDPVEEMDATEAVKWLIEIKEKNPEYRVAIIHRYGIKAVQEFLSGILADHDVSWYSVDDKKLSVLSVESAKGLEFEAVVAIVAQMTNNEKYISYTRALDRLLVVRDEFPDELILLEGADDLEDEFIERDDNASEGNTSSAHENTDNTLSEILDQKTDGDTSTEGTNSAEDISGAHPENLRDEDGMPLAVEFSKEEASLIAEFNATLAEQFDSKQGLTILQQQVVCSLYHGVNVAFSAPSGSMKSVILYLLALKERQTSGKQIILTAEAHLQENALVLAERLGLRGGHIVDSMDGFLNDFKKSKYDVIFVPFGFFGNEKNAKQFVEYFTDKVAYWGIDYSTFDEGIWSTMMNCRASLETTVYLMSRTGFSELNLDGFSCYEIPDNTELGIVRKQNLSSLEDRLEWLLQNIDALYGQGIIYCEDDSTCKMIGKHLRKNKIMAEAYVDVTNPEKKERINYLTNMFTNGGIPVLVTTHDAGRNLSNPCIRFIVHYALPENEQLHHLHISQIGALAENPVVFDLYVMDEA